jgi:hypothetical protein
MVWELIFLVQNEDQTKKMQPEKLPVLQEFDRDLEEVKNARCK